MFLVRLVRRLGSAIISLSRKLSCHMLLIPLVRTEGKIFAGGEPTLDPKNFIDETALQVASRSDKARAAEAAFGLGASLYFYAGYACPRFGDAVLVYEPTISDACSGNATPFDTGGLYLGLIHARGAEDDGARKQYCADALVPLKEWRKKAADFLVQYFATADTYVRGERATLDDPSGRLHHPENQREAWMWEIRFHGNHPLLQGLLFAVVSADYFAAIRNELMQPGITSTVRDGWHERLRNRKVIPTSAGESPHAHAEGRIIEWIQQQNS